MNTIKIYILYQFLLLSFLFITQGIFAQKDTVYIKPFKIVEKKNTQAYKTTVFDSSTINNTSNLAELLSDNSTVFIKSYGSGSLATASFRGTGASHTKVQWNGINLNSPMNGQIDFSLYPTFFFDAAEIHHGASGLIDGNGALGGSVLISSNEKYNKGLSVSLKQSVGSFGAYTTGLKGSYSNKKWFLETKLYNNTSDNNFDYINSSKANNPTESQINSGLKQQGVQQFVYRKFKNSSLGARLWYFNSDRELPPTMQVSENDENQEDEAYRALLDWKGLHNNLQYRVSTGFIKNKLIYNNKLANIHSNNNSYLSDNNINTKLYLNNNFILTNNFNIRYESAKADGYNENHERFNNSWLIGISKKIKQLDINLFNRLIMVEEELKPLAPTLGIKYPLIKRDLLNLKANAGLNYNYPTFNDLYWNPGGNEDLKPERANMVEFGLSSKKSTNRINFNTEITAFYSEVDDWIIWQPTEFGYWSPSNLKKVENKGLEGLFSASIKISNLNIKNKLSYAYTKSTNKKAKNETDDSFNKQLIYVPLHKLNYSISIIYKEFVFDYSYNYTGKRFTTSDNNWYLPANFISNISIAKKFILGNKTFIVGSFKVNNLLDQNYQQIAFRAIPGRNFLFSLNLHFN